MYVTNHGLAKLAIAFYIAGMSGVGVSKLLALGVKPPEVVTVGTQTCPPPLAIHTPSP